MADAYAFLHQQHQTLTTLCSGEAWSEESLHDYRVCLRRLQVAWPLLELLTPECPTQRNRIGRQLKASNRARDSQVLLTQLQQLSAPAKLIARLQAEQVAAKPVSPAWLKGLVEALALGCWRWEQVADHHGSCKALLLLQHRLYLHLVSELVEPLNRPQRARQAKRWHRLRVAIKRLRYLLEWLVTLDARWQSDLRTLKGWQERLGNISDLAMLHDWLHQRHLRRQPGAKRLLKQVCEQQQACQQQAFEQLPLLRQFLQQAQAQPEAAELRGAVGSCADSDAAAP